ncbi:MAG: hypothetical protein JO131_06185 [Gammaproteobacteria bacterium]|nr:hypothetical protein [Gammaproteobacteria bacterium]
MPKISIFLYSDNAPSHCCTHIAAKIEDEKSNKKIIIEYGTEETGSVNEIAYPDLKHQTIVLYSNKSIEEFEKLYNKKFQNGDYNFFTKNCADAVNFSLNYFFSEMYRARIMHTAKKVVCCVPINLLGFTCCPAPLMIETPLGVFTKAKAIAQTHSYDKASIMLSESLLKDELNNNGPSKQNMS